MTNGHDRRRFLQIAGTGAAASLAGCNALGNLTQDGDGGDDLLTVSVGPSQDDIDELVEAMESGEVEPAEAQQRQQELIQEAVADFQARAEEESDLTIEESTEELGLFRVDTSGGLLIDALRNGEVSSIHTGPAYERFLEQQRQRAPQQPSEGGNETGTGDDSEADSGDTEGSGTESGDGSENSSDGG